MVADPLLLVSASGLYSANIELGAFPLIIVAPCWPRQPWFTDIILLQGTVFMVTMLHS